MRLEFYVQQDKPKFKDGETPPEASMKEGIKVTSERRLHSFSFWDEKIHTFDRVLCIIHCITIFLLGSLAKFVLMVTDQYFIYLGPEATSPTVCQ